MESEQSPPLKSAQSPPPRFEASQRSEIKQTTAKRNHDQAKFEDTSPNGDQATTQNKNTNNAKRSHKIKQQRGFWKQTVVTCLSKHTNIISTSNIYFLTCFYFAGI